MPPPTMIHTSNNADLKSTLRARREADLCQAKRKLKHRHQGVAVPSSPVKPQQEKTISSPTPLKCLSLSPLALLPDCTPSRGESSSNNTRRQILLQALQDASSIAQEQEKEDKERRDGKTSSWSHPVVANDKVAPRRWSLTHVPVLIQEQDEPQEQKADEQDEMMHPAELKAEERKKNDAEEIYVGPLLMDEKAKRKEESGIIIPDWDAMAKNRRRSSTATAKGTPHPRLSKAKVVTHAAVPPPPPLTMDEDDNEEEYSQPLAPVVQQQQHQEEAPTKKTAGHQASSSSSRRRWSLGTGGAKKASSQRCLTTTSQDKDNPEWSSASAHHSSTRGYYYTPQTGVRKQFVPVQDEKRDSIHSERSATLHSHASSSRASTVIVVPSEHSCHYYPKGSVHFGPVTVYLHAYLLGDNPSVSDPSGPPLTIAWKAHQAIRYASPDEYQQDYPQQQQRRRRRIPTDQSMDPSIPSSPVDRTSRRLSVSKWTPKQRVDLILSSGSVTVQELAIAMVELDEQNGTSKKWTRVWERIWHSKQQQQQHDDNGGAKSPRRRRRRSTSRESKRRSNNSKADAMSGESKRSSSSNRKRLL